MLPELILSQNPRLTVSSKLCRACTRIKAWGSWLHGILLCWDNICRTALEEDEEKQLRE